MVREISVGEPYIFDNKTGKIIETPYPTVQSVLKNPWESFLCLLGSTLLITAVWVEQQFDKA